MVSKWREAFVDPSICRLTGAAPSVNAMMITCSRSLIATRAVR